MARANEIEFRAARVDAGPGGELARAIRHEIAEMYDGLELDGPSMPRAGPRVRAAPAERAVRPGVRAARADSAVRG